MRGLWRRLREEDRGQDLTEYALLLVLIALAAVAAMSSLGATISSVFGNANTSLS
jgi:Flp pilus assembly pilin Flp